MDNLQIIISLAALGVSIYAVKKINIVHVTFNSRMAEFIDLIKKRLWRKA